MSEPTLGDCIDALKELLDIVDNVRGLPEEDDDEPCEELCGNSWCQYFGCIPRKTREARAIIAKAEGR
jgi:hypothetical protein